MFVLFKLWSTLQMCILEKARKYYPYSYSYSYYSHNPSSSVISVIAALIIYKLNCVNVYVWFSFKTPTCHQGCNCEILATSLIHPLWVSPHPVWCRLPDMQLQQKDTVDDHDRCLSSTEGTGDTWMHMHA